MTITKRWQTITALSSAIALFYPSWAYPAQPLNLSPQDQEAVVNLLRACDSDSAKCKQANLDKDKVIQGQQKALDLLNAQNADLQKSQDAKMKENLFWFVGGVLLTGFTVHLISH